MIRVMFVCLGNICRSTMAQSVFSHMVKREKLEHDFVIQSCATSREEIGNPPHYGTVNKLRQVGIPVIPHQAMQLKRSDYEEYDYFIGMDQANIRDMNRILSGDPEGKVYKMLSFTDHDRDVKDPWFTGNFEETYDDITEGCKGFLEFLRRKGSIS